MTTTERREGEPRHPSNPYTDKLREHGDGARWFERIEAADKLDAERALADELAKVIDENFNVGRGTFIWEEDTPVPAVVEVMARYREARA